MFSQFLPLVIQMLQLQEAKCHRKMFPSRPVNLPIVSRTLGFDFKTTQKAAQPLLFGLKYTWTKLIRNSQRPDVFW